MCRHLSSSHEIDIQYILNYIFIRTVLMTVFNCNVCCSSFFVSGHLTFDDDDDDDNYALTNSHVTSVPYSCAKHAATDYETRM